MYNPPHPGEILKEEVIGVAGITIAEAAKQEMLCDIVPIKMAA